MGNVETIDFRKAWNAKTLPPKLYGLWLLGASEGKVYCASKTSDDVFSDLLIFGYSAQHNAIAGRVMLDGAGYTTSWHDGGDILYVGARFGALAAIDKETMRLAALKKYGNSIDCISPLDNFRYFGVNGDGVHKTGRRLGPKKKICVHEGVISAMVPCGDNMITFQYSDGNDAVLDVMDGMRSERGDEVGELEESMLSGGSPSNPSLLLKIAEEINSMSGGIVRVFNKDLAPVRRLGAPYAVTNALMDGGDVILSTHNTSNGHFPYGFGSIHRMNPSTLKCVEVADMGSAVNCLHMTEDGYVFAGLKDGRIAAGDAEHETVFSGEHEVTGLASVNGELFASSGNSVVKIKI